MGGITQVVESKKVLALKVYALTNRDRRRILNSLPKAVLRELDEFFQEIDNLKVPRELVYEFVWGKDASHPASHGQGSEWADFISVLEFEAENDADARPSLLINLLKSRLAVDLER